MVGISKERLHSPLECIRHNYGKYLRQTHSTYLLIKNKVCGDLNIAGIGAAQATANGGVADSKKIIRNTSTLAMITDKTPEEIEADGPECGNKKLRVVANRNGMQHAQGEYIDLQFSGDYVLYEEAKQHVPEIPF